MGTRVFKKVLWVVLAAVVSGCAASAPPRSDGGKEAVVTMGMHSFEPRTVTISEGDTVRWENKTLIWHTVTADPVMAKKAEDVLLPQGAQAFDSGKVEAGRSFQHTFTLPGTYRYFCQPHELKGMVGEVIVTPAGGGGEKR